MSEGIIFNAKEINPEYRYDATDEDRKIISKKSKPAPFIRKQRTYSEAKIQQLTKLYSAVAVHDFNDEYHMSEEDRKKKFKFYEAFAKVRRCKRKYRKLNDFVKVYRLCMDCLDIVANDNGVYDPEVFKDKVLKGKIEVFGLSFPKYVGKDRKEINWSYITEYIIDRSLDPNDLVKTNEESDYDEDEDLDTVLTRYFGKNYDEKITSYPEDYEPQWSGEQIVNDVDEWEDDCNVVTWCDKDQMKELFKDNPQIIKAAKDVSKKSYTDPDKLRSYIYTLSEDDFAEIERMDKNRGYYTDTAVPEFKGNLLKDKDFNKFMYQLEEYANNAIRFNYNGKMRTRSEINEIEIKDALEKDGWNIRNLYKDSLKEKKMKKAYKEGRKKEKELKKRLLAQQKKNGKMSRKDEIEFDSKKKGKKKKKNKKNKTEDDRNAKEYKREMNDVFDDILIESLSKDDYQDYNDYKNDMESFKFSDVF